jgi:rhodanese-related sulfurtransferase
MQQQIEHYANKLAFEIDSWDLAEAQKSAEDLVVLDARSSEAYEREHIPGALSFPHKRMNEAHTAQLSRAALYVVYCDGIGCNASTSAALKMTRLGFKVKELIGGLDWWKRSGFVTHNESHLTAEQAESCGCA